MDLASIFYKFVPFISVGKTLWCLSKIEWVVYIRIESCSFRSRQLGISEKQEKKSRGKSCITESQTTIFRRFKFQAWYVKKIWKCLLLWIRFFRFLNKCYLGKNIESLRSFPQTFYMHACIMRKLQLWNIILPEVMNRYSNDRPLFLIKNDWSIAVVIASFSIIMSATVISI